MKRAMRQYRTNQFHSALISIFVLFGSLFSQAQRSSALAGTTTAPQLKFTGTLTDVSGKPLSGAFGVTFFVYKDEHGGAPLWLETQDVQADAAGHYSVLLGSATVDGIPLRLSRSAKMYWISTQASGQQESARAPYFLNGAQTNGVDGTTYSGNWSGYVVQGSGFSIATGSWHVPEVACTKTPNDFSMVWVGIDGYADGTVEQVGTSSNCGGTDGTTPQYSAWYEFFEPPGVPRVVITSVPVEAGDIIGAYIEYSVLDIPFGVDIQYWTVWLKDYTTGQSYTDTFPYNSNQQRASAEWIVERPCCDDDGNDEPLADFGVVNLGGYLTAVPGTNYAADSSFEGNIGQFPSEDVIALTMTSNGKSSGTTLAVPGALEGMGGSAEGSFQVTWKATGP